MAYTILDGLKNVWDQLKDTPISATENAYQQNLSQPVQADKWYKGDMPTSREIYGRIGSIYQTNPEEAGNLLSYYRRLQNTPGSKFYWPYRNATNQAVYDMASYGYDMSNIGSDDWFNSNIGLRTYTTNAPSKPGKKSSQQEYETYGYYQLGTAHEDTKNVNKEWAALQKELGYWATDPIRNYTDDEIINNIDWKKYPTLAKMNDSVKEGGKILKLNQGTDYSWDAMYGTIWAARNGGGTGNAEVNAAYSVMGVGNQYIEDPELRAKLDPTNENYSPYSVGSTMEKEGLYFGRYYFNQKWLDQNSDMLNSQDATQRQMYINVMNAEAYTQKLEAQKEAMYAEINKYLAYTDDADAIINAIYDNNDYKDLFALDETISMKDKTKLKATTRAINYRKADIEAAIRGACDEIKNGPLPSEKTGETVETVSGTKPETTETEKANEAQRVANLQGAGLSVMKYGTDSERQAYIASQGGTVGVAIDLIGQAGINFQKSADIVIDSCYDMLKLNFGSQKVAASYRIAEENRNAAIYEQYGYMGELNDLIQKYQDGSITDEETKKMNDLIERNKVLNKQIADSQAYMDTHADEVREAKKAGSRTAENIALGDYLTDGDKALEQYARSARESRNNWLMNGDFYSMTMDELDESYALWVDKMNTAQEAYESDEDAIADYCDEAVRTLAGETGNNAILSERLNRWVEDQIYDGKPKDYNYWTSEKVLYAFYEQATGEKLESPSKEELDRVREAIEKIAQVSDLNQQASYANDKLLSIQKVVANKNTIAELEKTVSGEGWDSSAHYTTADSEDTDPYSADGVYYVLNFGYDYGLPNREVQYMTDVQRDTFNKLYNAGMKKEAEDYYNALRPTLDREKVMSDAEMLEAASKGGWGWLVGAATVPLNILSGITGGVGTFAALLGNEEAQNPNSVFYMFTRWTETVRQTRGQMLDDNLVRWFGEGAKGVGNFISGVAYSIFDNLASMGVSGGVKGAKYVSQGMVQLLMSSEAAASSMYHNLEKGMDPVEAAFRAIGTGAIEAVTEKYSLEQLLNVDLDVLMSSGKNIAGFLFTNAFTEGTEEVASDLLNLVMDVAVSAIAGHENEIEAKVKALIAKDPDMAMKDAIAQVWGEYFTDTVQSFAAGGLSGFLMSGGRLGLNALDFEKSGHKNRGSMDSIINEALSSDTDASIRQLAEELQNKKSSNKRISNYDLGRLKFGTDLTYAGTKYRDSLDKMIDEAQMLDKGSDIRKLAVDLESKKVSGEHISDYEIGRLAYGIYGDTAIKRDEQESTAEEAAAPVAETTETKPENLKDAQLTKDLTILFQTAKNGDDQAQGSTNIASVLYTDMDKTTAIAAGMNVVQNIAGGDAHVAAHTVAGLLDVAVSAAKTQQAAQAVAAEVTEQETPAKAVNMEEAAQTVAKGTSALELLGWSVKEEAVEGSESDETQNVLYDENGNRIGTVGNNGTVFLDKGVDNQYSDALANAGYEKGAYKGFFPGETADVSTAEETAAKNAMQDVVQNATRNALSGMKKSIAFAAVTSGESNKTLRGIAQKVANNETVTQQDAEALQNAVEEDQTGPNSDALNAQMQSVIEDTEIAMEEMGILSERGVDNAVKAAEANVNQAKNALAAAQSQQQRAQAEAEAAADNLRSAESEYNPSIPETAATLQQAANHVAGTVTNKNQAAQTVANAQQKVADAEKNLEQTSNTAMNAVRQEAIANVQQQKAEAAELAAQQAEQQRIAEEQAAQMQAEEDQRSGKADEDRTAALIEDLLNQDHLEGEEREQKRKQYLDMAEKIKLKKIDMTGLMNNAEGYLAVMKLARKLGVDVKLSDQLGNARGKYENGVVYLNQNLIKNGKMTIGQALIEAALHEFTHDMEMTGNYKKYAKAVDAALFRGDAAARRAAIDQKKADYLQYAGQELDDPGAMKEIVADFARTHLNTKEIVDRLCDEGFGAQIRNTLHNINQALKNFNLKGEERITAEYLRRAERMFQKTIDEQARKAVHPDGGQFSVMQFAQSAGLNVDENTLTLTDAAGRVIDGINNKVTPDMINGTPVGMLIDMAQNGSQTKKGVVKFAPTISPETAQSQKQMFADLMNMVAQYKDSDLVWEIASSTLFSALKANSDPQYSTTVDFGTVCAKTQEIINVMSRVMLEKGRGLTREEVLKVYNETANAGLTVPCPVCYVFSRWMGVPSLLNQMSQFQKRFVKTGEDGSIDVKATEKAANKYIKAALDKYGDKEGIDKAKVSIQNRMRTQEKNRSSAVVVMNSKTATESEKADAKVKHDAAIAKLDELTNDLGEVEAYNWVTQALMKETKKNSGKYVFDPEFQVTPDEVLFDLRRTGDFAKFTKNWTYRNTRGAGMGKAIMPYSGMSIGDIIYGTERKEDIKNPFLTQTPGKASDGVKNAIVRARRQNLIGGQRLQSTSDFRPEWGLDYMMAFLELQAVGSKVQMYTKVAEAVDLLASMGGDINLSIMGSGSGFHEASAEEIALANKDTEEGKELRSRMGTLDGKTYVLDFSDVTGMKYETAKALKNKYSNVQAILVGMNDIHIRLAMANPDIDFIIPWHSSGNSRDALSSMISSVGEKLETSSDYTETQTDQPSENQTDEQKELWELRMKILQGKSINAKERNTIYHDSYLMSLYQRFNEEGVDPDCYHVKLGKDQAEQIFPYEYWDKTSIKENADINGKRFVEYCEHFGLVPRFSQFKDDPGYWKVLIDRPMYDNNGNYRDQQVVDVTKAKIGSLDENGHLVDSDLPLTTSAMYGPNYSDKEKTAVDNTLAALDDQAGINGGQYSVFGDVTLADMEQMMSQTNSDYMDAVSRGDMEAAQKDVDFAADQAGYTDEAYHGTQSFGFTEFDMDASHGEIFVAYSPELSRTYTDEAPVREIGKPSVDPETLSNEALAERLNSLENKKGGMFNDIYLSDIKPISQGEMQSFVRQNVDTVLQSLEGKGFNDVIPALKDYVKGDQKSKYVEDAARGTNIPAEEWGKCDTPKDMAELFVERCVYGNDGTAFNYNLLNGLVSTYCGVSSPAYDSTHIIADNAKLAFGDEGRDGVFRMKAENNNHVYDSYSSRKDMIDLYNRVSKEGIYKLRTRPGRQLVVDANGAVWSQIPWSTVIAADASAATDNDESSKAKTRGIADWARSNGYDSVRINNVRDKGPRGGTDEPGDIGIFFNQKDVKSGDAVTYDNEGNPIPPSERFTSNPDIRYSTGGETTTADMEQRMLEAGVITQEDLDSYHDVDLSQPAAVPAGPQRQFGNQTAQRSDELADVAKRYLYEHSNYTPDTNQSQVERAVDWIRGNRSEGDPEGYMSSVQKVVDKNYNAQTPDGQARMLATLAMAIAKGDVAAQTMIADAYNKEGTTAGQTLQSRKIFRLMTPEGRVTTLRKMLTDEQSRLNAKGIDVNLKFSDWIYRAAAAASEEGDFQKVRKAAAEELAEQLPSNWREKIRSFRMLSMLANPRTHIRNIIGNAMFIPAVSLKNKLGAVMESGMKQGNRTKTLAPILSKDIREFARQDAIKMKETLTGEAKYNEETLVEQAKKPFSGAFQWLSDLNSNALEAEDWFFLKGHYRRALGGWMQANGYSVADVQDNAELLDKGRAYAIQEAQKATYRDFNQLASTLNQISRKGGVAGFLTDAVLPFKKTPANILKRGLEYSPIGLAKSLTADMYHLREYQKAMKNGTAMPTKAMSPTQVIDDICSGLSGSAVFTLGMILANLGLVSVGLDDDDDEFDKLRGEQEYAVRFNLFGSDVTFTMDWAAPMSMPFFVGAAVQKQFEDQGEVNIEDLANAAGNIMEPVFNLSMLDGVNTLFKTSQNDDTNTLTQIGAKVLSNYATSYVPSIAGAVARTIDDKRRKAYVKSGEGQGVLGTFRYAYEQTQNKIPGWSQSNIPYRDVWGNAEESGLLERIAENFILPGYVQNRKEDIVVDELERLYNATGNASMIPKDPGKTITLGTQVTDNPRTIKLTDQEWDDYKVARGQTAYNTLQDMMTTDYYLTADPEDQAKLVSEVWEYANIVGKQAVAPDYKPQKDYGSDPVQTIIKDYKKSVKTKTITALNTELLKAVEAKDANAYDAMVEALHENGVDDDTIKTKIANKYRDQYKAAYKADDLGKMIEIENMLDMTGFRFDFKQWRKDADKKQD